MTWVPDRCGLVAILVYTATVTRAVATLRRGSFYHAGEQWMLHFEEKGGKLHTMPCHHSLEQCTTGLYDRRQKKISHNIVERSPI